MPPRSLRSRRSTPRGRSPRRRTPRRGRPRELTCIRERMRDAGTERAAGGRTRPASTTARGMSSRSPRLLYETTRSNAPSSYGSLVASPMTVAAGVGFPAVLARVGETSSPATCTCGGEVPRDPAPPAPDLQRERRCRRQQLEERVAVRPVRVVPMRPREPDPVGRLVLVAGTHAPSVVATWRNRSTPSFEVVDRDPLVGGVDEARGVLRSIALSGKKP